MNRLTLVLLACLSFSAIAGDYAVSWEVDDPAGITEYAIGGKVGAVASTIIYTGSPALSRTVRRTAAAGQVVTFNVAACNAAACGAWGPTATLTAVAATAPEGEVTTTTVTSVRVRPPALP